MKLQFPFTIGVFVASFGALGCGVSNSEIPDKSYWNQDASVGDAGIPGFDASTAADGGSASNTDGGGSVNGGSGGGSQHHTGGSGGNGGGVDGSVADSGGGGEQVDAGDSGSPMDAGVDSGSEPVAGSGGSGGAPAAGSGGSGGSGSTCPTEYTLATHVVINVSWDATTATAKSVDSPNPQQVHIWTKSKFVENGNTATVVSRSCGSKLPTIYASNLAKTFTGTDKILPEIPNATWEVGTMPSFTGTATKNGNTVTMNPGPALVGLTMSNPSGGWPAVGDVDGVDHDSDGKLGLTAIPKTTDGYDTIPVGLSSSPRADKLYLAIRNIMTMTATVNGCPDTYNGTANVTKFDNHVIGCHIAGGTKECTTDQRNFVDQNTTVYKLGTATFKSARIDDNATCAQVRAAVP